MFDYLKPRRQHDQDSSRERNPDHIESPPYAKYIYWLRKKTLEVFLRSHLSGRLALLLVGLVVWREYKPLRDAAFFLTLRQWAFCILLVAVPLLAVWLRWTYVVWGLRKKHWFLFVAPITLAVLLYWGYADTRDLFDRLKSPDAEIAFDWLVLIIAIGTLGAAVWELIGEKLSNSPRDTLFGFYVRILLEKMATLQTAAKASQQDLLNRFTKELLKAACETLCGKCPVSGAYLKWIDTTDGPFLKMSVMSPNADYDRELSIPVGPKEKGPGPAAYAYKNSAPHPIYMPDKTDGKAWVIAQATWEQCFKFNDPATVGWYPARLEDFCSVLCVPVRSYLEGAEVNCGILTVSTKRRDPFLPRDFIMAECFARILGQAITTVGEQPEEPEENLGSRDANGRIAPSPLQVSK